VVIFVMMRLDGRVRSAQEIEVLAHVPLLLTIGSAPAPVDRSRERKRERLAMLMVAGVFVVYIATFIIKQRA
jgi:hypothetical protein